MGRIIGLDVGDKRTGVALSDPSETMALGLCVIEAEGIKALVKRVKDIAAEHEAARIVVGLPLNMDGSSGERARRSLKVARKLRDETGLEVMTWDERLTTVQAERVLLEADLSRSRRKRVIDKMSAVLMLQGYLDRHRAKSGERG